MLQSSSIAQAHDNSHIYYDITVNNNDTSGVVPVPLVFNETRNSPFIHNAEEYYCSIVRFSLETQSLPVFIPQPIVDQDDVNLLELHAQVVSSITQWSIDEHGAAVRQRDCSRVLSVSVLYIVVSCSSLCCNVLLQHSVI